ncbi:right-handed parallel beta-helix repeat-containing protein [Rubrivirga sp. IMCC43871]|uniref:right-handed parallel beta-helix repeat-containing protein n=1 Tax=Rubrivirga sp. IMCC43871 TaxID=3391575 RepID=UPI0039900694
MPLVSHTSSALRALALAAAVLMSGAASAAIITVDTLADEVVDDSNCSLREAVQAANTDKVVDACVAGQKGPDSIVFAPGLSNGTVVFKSGAIAVTDTLSIDGTTSSTSRIALDGNLFFQIFVVREVLTVEDLELRRGRAARGGAVFVADSAKFAATNVSFLRNEAFGNAATDGGGAIYNDGGDVDLRSTDFQVSNASGTSGSGGAVFNNGGTLAVQLSLFLRNEANRAGGAIESRGGTTTLDRVTFDQNEAGSNPGNGGAFHISEGGSATIDGGTVTGNVASSEGGGFWNNTGTMTIVGTTFTDNEASGASADNGGGALFNNGGRMVLTQVTVTGNSATGAAGSGGGVFNAGGELVVSRSTISDNEAQRAGGGIEDAEGEVAIVQSTFLNNGVAIGANPGNGGAVHSGAGELTIVGGRFEGNSAVEGGAIWTSGELVISDNLNDLPSNLTPVTLPTITDPVITNNEATGDDSDQGGGGVYATAAALVTITNSVISANTASGTAGSGGGVFSAGDLTIRTAEVTGNVANRAGGGIEDAGGTVDLEDVELTDNSIGTAAPGNGGGLHSGGGNVSITRGVVTGNTAVEGGGLWTSGSITINGGAGPGDPDGNGVDNGRDDNGDNRRDDDDDAVDGARDEYTSIADNVATGAAAGTGGGGIYVETGGAVSVRYATIEDNAASGASGSGGGLLVADGASARLTFADIVGNTAKRAGAGIELFDDSATSNAVGETSLTLRKSTVDDNEIVEAMPGNGGGIHAGGAASILIQQSTISRNDAREGGGLWVAGGVSATVQQSTVSGNTAADDGGGIYDDGGAAVSLASTTVLQNIAGMEGGGLVSQGATFSLNNTIVARNSAATNPDCDGTFQSGGYNLIQNTSGCTVQGLTASNVTGADPMLRTLGDYGGPTRTHVPIDGSPAIDAGQSSFVVDQRGLPRGGQGGNTSDDDIGSVELGSRPVAIGDGPEVEAVLALRSVHPNPATSRATMAFSVATAGPARVELFNVLGQRVLTAFDGQAAPGAEVAVDVDLGRLAAGVYLVRLESEGAAATRRLTVVR